MVVVGQAEARDWLWPPLKALTQQSRRKTNSTSFLFIFITLFIFPRDAPRRHECARRHLRYADDAGE